MKPVFAEKSTASSSLITILISQPFLDLFEIDVAFPLENYVNVSEIYSEGFVGASGTSPVPWQSGSLSPSHPDFIIDQAYVSRAPASTDYMNWQFEVGGQVAVAYAVQADDPEEREDRYAEWEDLSCSVSENTEVTHPTAGADYTTNSTYGGIVPVVGPEARPEGEGLLGLNSGSFDECGRSNRYRRLVLTPRTLPPPLPPVQNTKPRASAWTNPRKAVKADEKAEPKAGNMFDSLVSSDDESDDMNQSEEKAPSVAFALRPQLETEWTCAHCTFINRVDNGQRICIMCENFAT